MFTNHGFHHNKLGKQHLLHQIALMVYTLTEHETTVPTELGWNKSEDPITDDKPLNRINTRNKKVPIARSKDFLW
jgi:hypothetical protein